MSDEIKLQIVLQKPPPGVDFGLQKGSGNNYEIVQKQRSKNDLEFEFTVRVKLNKDSSLNFLGPFVQGPAGGRFVYISIGTYAGQTDSVWSRRLKIPLTGITNQMWKQLQENSQYVLITHVPGTGKDGGPNCATVKPFEGWKPSKGKS